MPEISKQDYGRKELKDGGWIIVMPTVRRFVEEDGTDVRLDRVYVYDKSGRQIKTYLRDKMFRRFADNLPNTEDDPAYLNTLEK